MIYLGSGILGVGGLLTFCTYVVEGGERALIFNKFFWKGVGEKAYGEGLHFRIPLLQETIKIDIRLNYHLIETRTSTKDLQNVEISVRILYKPDETKLYNLYILQQKEYAQRSIPQITHEIIKSVVARYNAEQLLQQREKVSDEIKNGMILKAQEFNLIFSDVAIIHIEFSKEFRSAIENKQVSQQMAERAKFIVQKSEEEKKLTIIRAEADSESATLFNEAISKHGTAFLELKKNRSCKGNNRKSIKN